MEEKPGLRRGWHWVAAAMTAGALVFLNLDGYHTSFAITFRGSGDFYGEPPTINWTHGWPFVITVRTSIYPLAAGKGGPVPARISGELGYYSRWPLDEAPLVSFHWLPLLLDLAILALLVAGTWLAARRIGGRWPLPLRFNLKFLFLATFVVAVVVGFNLFSLLPRHVLQFAALGVALSAALATALGAAAAGFAAFRRVVRLARSAASAAAAER